jgi:hypothetical protein
MPSCQQSALPPWGLVKGFVKFILKNVDVAAV